LAVYRQVLALCSAKAVELVVVRLEKVASSLSKSTPIPTEMTSKMNCYDRLCCWLIAGGAKVSSSFFCLLPSVFCLGTDCAFDLQFPKIRILSHSEDYRGLRTVATTEPHETLVYVPQTHIITTEVAVQSDIGKRIGKLVGGYVQLTWCQLVCRLTFSLCSECR